MTSVKHIQTNNMDQTKLVRTALILSIITIIYNVIEGVISVFFGLEDDTLALLGFGVDSFVEVISGLGIMHMIFRMKKAGLNDVASRDNFERLALRITGTAFYLLTVGLVAGAVLNIVTGAKPTTTLVGILISSISILTMFVLMRLKMKVGKQLHSDAIIADARCTQTCFYLSFILLAASGLYELFGIAWFDALGALGIAWFASSEGRESFEKAASAELSCTCHD